MLSVSVLLSQRPLPQYRHGHLLNQPSLWHDRFPRGHGSPNTTLTKLSDRKISFSSSDSSFLLVWKSRPNEHTYYLKQVILRHEMYHFRHSTVVPHHSCPTHHNLCPLFTGCPKISLPINSFQDPGQTQHAILMVRLRTIACQGFDIHISSHPIYRSTIYSRSSLNRYLTRKII